MPKHQQGTVLGFSTDDGVTFTTLAEMRSVEPPAFDLDETDDTDLDDLEEQMEPGPITKATHGKFSAFMEDVQYALVGLLWQNGTVVIWRMLDPLLDGESTPAFHLWTGWVKTVDPGKREVGKDRIMYNLELAGTREQSFTPAT